MTLIDFKEIPIHAGSIRVTVENCMGGDQEQSVTDRINEERKNIAKLSFFEKFGRDVAEHIDETKKQLSELASSNKIVGYGASGRANMFCNVLNLTKNEISYIVDESPERCGRYIANREIPIVDKDTLEKDDVDIIFIFAWNYSKMIIEKTRHKNCKYFVAFPKPQLVESYEELEGFDSI